MSVFILFVGCFILYGRSRFFPENLIPIETLIKKYRQIASILGYLFLVLSYVLFSYRLGWGTGFVMYLVALSLCYGALITVLSLNKRYIYVIAMLCFLLMFFENFLL